MRNLAFILVCLLATSCGPKIGPYNVRHDSVDYNVAVKTGIDKQLLLNIVRLRYRDTPTFLEVGLVSANYDFKRSFASAFETGTDDVFSVGWKPSIGVDYSEKPTTTYNPLRGKSFVDQLLSPIRFDTVLLLNSSGWRVDRLLRCCVQRMNGIRNAPSASGPTPSKVPEYKEFLDLMELFADLERTDSLHLMKKLDADSGKPYYLLAIEQDTANPQVMNQLWNMLELDPGTYQFYITRFAGKKHRGNEISVETRSPMSLMYFLSHAVDVPIWDTMTGRVTLTTDEYGESFDWENVLGGLMQVNSWNCRDWKEGRCLPRGAVYVAYRGSYYYIDDRDLDSKSTFSLLSQLLALQTGCPELPVLTLPVVQ